MENITANVTINLPDDKYVDIKNENIISLNLLEINN